MDIQPSRYLQLGELFCRKVVIQELDKPVLQASSPATLQLLGISKPSQEFLKATCFCQSRDTPDLHAVALAYAGHQFGKFNPFLGDGRCAVLGEVNTASGTEEISLKGIGRTPYSRDLDGLAGISECLYEFSIYEKLHTLEIPTIRGVCVYSGSRQIYRNGYENTAILYRLAPSHIRFGSFEYWYFLKNFTGLQKLADLVIAHHFASCINSTRRYAAFFNEVVIHTARLIATWQAHGFAHGAMNTDNQSIIGITIDTGVSGFTDERDPGFISNPLDTKARYAFGQQPAIGLWNCNVLARALSELISGSELKTALKSYEPAFLDRYRDITGRNFMTEFPKDGL